MELHDIFSDSVSETAGLYTCGLNKQELVGDYPWLNMIQDGGAGGPVDGDWGVQIDKPNDYNLVGITSYQVVISLEDYPGVASLTIDFDI